MSLEPFVQSVGQFVSGEALRKWVNNYFYIVEQCRFPVARSGRIETFADYWGLQAIRLFFERAIAIYGLDDSESLVREAYKRDLHKLLGVPRTWLERRIDGAAEMFLAEELYVFDSAEETQRERQAVVKSITRPPEGAVPPRRAGVVEKLIRRGGNRRFLYKVYEGVCQVSGITLRLPDGGFTIDCSHIRPLGAPHDGSDDVSNMLCLAPTMHRLFDRGCILINSSNLTIQLLHGNDSLPHRAALLLDPEHPLNTENLEYYNSRVLRH